MSVQSVPGKTVFADDSSWDVKSAAKAAADQAIDEMAKTSKEAVHQAIDQSGSSLESCK